MTAILVSLTRHFPIASAIRAVWADAAVAGRRINDWRLDLLNSDWHARVRVWMDLAGVRAHSTTTQPELDQAPHDDARCAWVPGYCVYFRVRPDGPYSGHWLAGTSQRGWRLSSLAIKLAA
jgi:hypothetical protein